MEMTCPYCQVIFDVTYISDLFEFDKHVKRCAAVPIPDIGDHLIMEAERDDSD